MPRGYENYNRGRHHSGFDVGFGTFGVPFLGGLAGGLLGNVLFPGYGNYGNYGYGSFPFYGGYPYPSPYSGSLPYGYMPYDYYRPYY